jgi:hypothetical protein
MRTYPLYTVISRRNAILAASLAPAAAAQNGRVDRGPALESALVKQFVVAAHGSLERTEELLREQPGLINATWDWGGGDFETALGGASHMGARDIATFLISKGARMDVFAAAMLGKLDVIRAAVAAFPGIQRTLGPHKIPLLQHARKGGPEASAVVEYLESLGS